MTTTNKYLKRFEAYQNGELDPGEVKAFKRALGSDEEMLLAWKEYQAMIDAWSDKEAISLRIALEKAYTEQGNKGIVQLSQNIWFRASAAAVIIILTGCLMYFFCSNGLKQNTVAEEENSTLHDIIPTPVHTDTTMLITVPINQQIETNESEQDQIASIFDKEEYQISAVFAELLNNVYRSNWFMLKTPADSAMIHPGENIVFSWETNIKAQIYFDVLDRNGQVIYKQQGPVNSPWTYIPTLDPAIYMFRFATEEEPVWMGVVIVK